MNLHQLILTNNDCYKAGKAKTRIGTLDRIVSKLYEDNVEGKISDERFATMLLC